VITGDGSENPVEFFSGTNCIGIVSSPPYVLVVSNLATGSHDLTAAYTDLIGNRSTSAAVHITLTPLVLRNPVRLADGRFQFEVFGVSIGDSYEIQSSHLLNTGEWISIDTKIASSNVLSIVDPTITNAQLRFYRARHLSR
jgi:hypothetical protein